MAFTMHNITDEKGSGPDETRLHAVWLRVLYPVLLVLVMVLASCGKEGAPPAPKDQPSATNPAAPLKPLIIIDSGLGGPQLREIAELVQREFPNAGCADFQTGPNAYKADLLKYVKDNPHTKLVIIAHSWGVSNAFNVLGQLGDVDLFLDIDGVRNFRHGQFTVTPNCRRVVVVTGDFSWLIREPIHGPYHHFMVHGDHNAMTKSPELMNLVRWTVGEVLK